MCNDFLKNNSFLNDDDLILMLLPTQPFRSLIDISNIINESISTKRNIFSCREYGFPLSFAFELDKENNHIPIFNDSPLSTGNTRSQDQKTYYHPDGSIYVVSVGSLKKNYKSIYQNAKPFFSSGNIYIDVDSEEDFSTAVNYGGEVLKD